MTDPHAWLTAGGFALAALAYLVLTLLIVAGWRQRPQGRVLAVATLAAFCWALLATFQPAGVDARVFALFEIGHLGAWLFLLFHILDQRVADAARLPYPLRLIRLIVIGLALATCAAIMLPGSGLLKLPLVLVVYAIFGLVLVEQIYRGTRKEDRWAIKFLCLGLGALFVFDFYLFANVALFGKLEPEVWAARGYIAALIVPLIAVAAARNPQWSAPVNLSRRVAFHTASLVASGLYLLLMAGAGYYLKHFGGDWGKVLATVFVFAAGVAGLLALLSGTLRARFRVSLSKHFFSYRYDYREEWLKFTRALTEGRPDDHLNERAVEALARLVESPGGALWSKEDSQDWCCRHHWNWGESGGDVAGDAPLALWLETRGWILDLDEWRRTPERYDFIDLPDWLAAQPDAWLVVPLLQHEQLLGFVILKRSLARVSFNWEVSDLLKVASRQAAAHLAQLHSANALIVARQFESFNRTTTFVIHDLKNLVAQLSLLLANAEKHRDNPEFQADMLETIASAVTRMNKVLAQLRRADDDATTRVVPLATILTEAATSKRAFRLHPTLQLPPPDVRVRADPARLARAVGHLLQNALEATPENGEVMLAAHAVEGEDEAEIEIRDTGVGMDEDFIRTRLFQPFDSTKGAGMGIGVYECRETVRMLGGRMSVESTPGKGTRFIVRLPLVSTAGVEH